MASSVGHALCGISCLLAVNAASPSRSIVVTGPSALLFIALANLPDVDFLVGYLVARDPHWIHQGPTHSLLFAVAVGLLAGFAWRKRPGPWLASAVFAATILSHDIIDIFTGPAPGFNRSPGLALWWPLETELISAPVTIFPGIRHLTLSDLVSWHNFMAIILETAIFMPIIALLVRIRRRP